MTRYKTRGRAIESPSKEVRETHLQQLLQVLVLPRPALSLGPAALPALFEPPPLNPPQPTQFFGGAVIITPGGRDTSSTTPIPLLGPV